MATLKEQQIQGLVEAKVGIETRDKERALKGIDKYINIGLTLIEIEENSIEAEKYDQY